MATESIFPKIGGDIAYAADANLLYGNSAENFIQIFHTDLITNGSWQRNLQNQYVNTYWDTFIATGSPKIHWGLSTGSLISGGTAAAWFQNQMYVNGSPGNSGFESAFVSGLNNWYSGTFSGATMFAGQDTNWASKTGTNNLRLLGSFANVVGQRDGSAWVTQLVDTTNLIGIRIDHGYTFGGGEGGGPISAHLDISGVTLFTVNTGSAQVLNSTYNFGPGSYSLSFLTGSQVLRFIIECVGGAHNTSATWNIDEVRYLRGGSTNSIPNSLISSGLAAQSGKNFRTGFIFSTGSFPSGTIGSYYLSANSGTNWEAVGNRSGIQFANTGNILRAKIDLYSSGDIPQIFNYGVTATQS